MNPKIFIAVNGFFWEFVEPDGLKLIYMVFQIPTSVISLDMARHPCPWEVSDLCLFDLDFQRCLRSPNIRWFFETMCPHDDDFLPVPRFPLLGNSGGDYQSVYTRLTLATGDGLRECLHPCLLLGSVRAVGIFDSE
ncbi:hypothetical protein Tco_0048797 [Tanacetum coccineum]